MDAKKGKTAEEYIHQCHLLCSELEGPTAQLSKAASSLFAMHGAKQSVK